MQTRNSVTFAMLTGDVSIKTSLITQVYAGVLKFFEP